MIVLFPLCFRFHTIMNDWMPVDINYDHPLYTPTYEDPYWENMEGLLTGEGGVEEEDFEEPKTPTKQGIVPWEDCPSPERKNKRVIVSIGPNDRMVTNLFLSTRSPPPNVDVPKVEDLLKLVRQRPTSVVDDSIKIGLANEDPKEEILKYKVQRELVQQERSWRQYLNWNESDSRISIVRRNRDMKEWIGVEEKQRLRRVHEYSADSVRDGKRRKLKLCSDHPEPLTPYHHHRV